MADYQLIPRELAKKSLILSDAVLGFPGSFSVPDRAKFWNLGIRSSVNPEYGLFALVMSDRREDGCRGDVRIYSRPLSDFDKAREALQRELAILREVGYNVK